MIPYTIKLKLLVKRAICDTQGSKGLTAFQVSKCAQSRKGLTNDVMTLQAHLCRPITSSVLPVKLNYVS